MESSVARRSQKLTALGVRRPWTHMVSQRWEMHGGGREAHDSSRGKALLKFIWVQTACRLAVAPRPSGLPKMRLLRGHTGAAVSVLSRNGLEGWWGRGNTCLLTPQSSHNLLLYLLGYIGLVSSEMKNRWIPAGWTACSPQSAALHPGHSLCTIDGP